MRLIDADALKERFENLYLDENGEVDYALFTYFSDDLSFEFIFEFIDSMLTENEWISVKDRLPEENVAVNIVYVNTDPENYYEHIKGKEFTATGVYFREQWYWWSSVVQDYLGEYGVGYTDKMDKAIIVTHWMPMPEPPKEDE